jgi:hypothetical protein
MVPIEANYGVVYVLSKLRLWEESLLTNDRIADVELSSTGSYKEAITTGMKVNLTMQFTARKLEEGP